MTVHDIDAISIACNEDKTERSHKAISLEKRVRFFHRRVALLYGCKQNYPRPANAFFRDPVGIGSRPMTIESDCGEGLNLDSHVENHLFMLRVRTARTQSYN